IYRYAREQWVLRGGQPVRKCLPASVAKFGLRRRERESGWHGLAELRTRGIAGREHVVGFSGPLGIFFHGPKHRQRFGWLQFIDLFQVVLILLHFFGRHDLFNLGRVNPQNGVIIIGDLLFPRGTRLLRLANGGLHLFRQNRQSLFVEPVVVRRDEPPHFFVDGPVARLVLRHRPALGK